MGGWNDKNKERGKKWITALALFIMNTFTSHGGCWYLVVFMPVISQTDSAPVGIDSLVGNTLTAHKAHFSRSSVSIVDVRSWRQTKSVKDAAGHIRARNGPAALDAAPRVGASFGFLAVTNKILIHIWSALPILRVSPVCCAGLDDRGDFKVWSKTSWLT